MDEHSEEDIQQFPTEEELKEHKSIYYGGLEFSYSKHHQFLICGVWLTHKVDTYRDVVEWVKKNTSYLDEE